MIWLIGWLIIDDLTYWLMFDWCFDWITNLIPPLYQDWIQHMIDWLNDDWFDWLIVCLINDWWRLTGWWLIDRRFDWLVDWLNDWLVVFFDCSYIPELSGDSMRACYELFLNRCLFIWTPFWFTSVFQSTAYLKFAKLQYGYPGFRCRVITGSLMRLY